MGNMVVITTTAVPDHVRGALSRWMTEPSVGVYVGTMSARVRKELWEAVSASVGGGAAVCMHPGDNEQGYEILTAGERRREVVDWEGMRLVQMNPAEPPEAVPPESPWG